MSAKRDDKVLMKDKVLQKFPIMIEGTQHYYSVHGGTYRGNDTVLLKQPNEINLALGTSWDNLGYVISDLPSQIDIAKLTAYINEHLKSIFLQFGFQVPTDFHVRDYHESVVNEDLHLKVAATLSRGISLDRLPFPYSALDDVVSRLCGREVSCSNKDIAAANRFCIRLVRPGVLTDCNPPHKDAWLDRLRNAINVYLPIAGSNELSSLPLIPASHYWNEANIKRTKQGARVNGVTYSVPCAVTANEGLSLIRPKVDVGQFLLFSPYLIHGAGINLNNDVTRISLEIRFWSIFA